MKNFEEQYTAWMDGALEGAEKAEFEATLPDREAALRESAGWQSLRGLLRETMVPAPMPHGDFVNSQILNAIEREAKVQPEQARGWFTAARLSWAGAFLLLLATTLSVVMLRRDAASDQANLISQVIEARTGDPKLGAYAFVAPGGKGAVLWVSDAGYIPANEHIK
jgi:anti-sigma factor RsiW